MPAREPWRDDDPAGGRVVVGVDGSAASQSLIRQAATLAGLLGCRLDVVAAYLVPAAYFPAMRMWPDDVDRSARANLDRLLHDAFGGPAPAGVVPVAVPGDPVKVLLHQAATASLLVLGRATHARLAGAVLGSVSATAVARARCPVLVVPDGGELDLTGRRRIVVGVNGSPSARGALRWAARLSWATGAGLDAVLATEPVLFGDPLGLRPLPELLLPSPHACLERYVAEALGDRRPPGLRVIAVSGTPGELLHRRAADAAVLVLGRHGGAGPLGRWSAHVARRCLHGATRPLLVVPEQTGPVRVDVDVHVPASEHGAPRRAGRPAVV